MIPSTAHGRARDGIEDRKAVLAEAQVQRGARGAEVGEVGHRGGAVRSRWGWRVTRIVLALALSACGQPAQDPSGSRELSEFAENVSVSGRVLENITGCEVDAICYLRIEFADTTIVALYGTGESPAPQCEITRNVSNAAFRIERGEIVKVILSMCDAEGHYIRQIAREAG